MKARVLVRLKKGVLDPQGKAVQQALHRLNFAEVSEVRVGKLIELEIEGKRIAETESKIRAMAEQVLANTVVESYTIEWE